MKLSNELGKTKELFEPLYERSLTNQEAFSINHNLLGFFQTLIKIDQRNGREVKNEPN